MATLKPTLHHLTNSSSQRVIWLLEELAIPYDLKVYIRPKVGPRAGRAPDELKDRHPLGKAPQLETGNGRTIVETSAIIKYLIDTYDKDKKFQGDEENDVYRDEELCSLGNTSINIAQSLKALMDALTSQMPFFLRPVILPVRYLCNTYVADPDLTRGFRYLEDQLGDQDYFMGKSPGRADFILSLNVELCAQRKYLNFKDHPKLEAWFARIHERPAWKVGLEKGGSYDFAWF